MPPTLPAYKPGDYLECGEGETFTRVLVLSENKVLLKEGVAAGSVMTMDEWYFIIGDARGTIQNTSYFDTCKGCPYYVNDPVCADASIESIGAKSCLHTPSVRSQSSICSVSITTQPTLSVEPAIQTQMSLRRVEVPVTKRTWNDWFTRVFLCGLID